MDWSNVAVIIPARRNSQRVVGKNFKPFAGGPSLLDRAISFAQSAIPESAGIVVTTDHPTWAAPEHVQLVRRRHPADLPELPMRDVLIELLPLVECPLWCLLPPTSPFRQRIDLVRAGARLLDGVDSVLSTTTSGGPGGHPGHTPCGAVYLFRRRNLEVFGHLFGRTWATVKAVEPCSIDTPEQFTEAEARQRQLDLRTQPKHT